MKISEQNFNQNIVPEYEDWKQKQNNSSFSSSFIVRGFFSDSYYFGFTFCSFYTI